MATFRGWVELVAGGQVIGAGYAHLASTRTRADHLEWSGRVDIDGPETADTWPTAGVTLRIVETNATADAVITNVQRIPTTTLRIAACGGPPPF